MIIWSNIVATCFACGIIAQLVTARFYSPYVGWEIWWEIPLIVVLTLSVWMLGAKYHHH